METGRQQFLTNEMIDADDSILILSPDGQPRTLLAHREWLASQPAPQPEPETTDEQD